MHKLVIMIGPLEDWNSFEGAWPEFLHAVEGMPGLRREATSRVEQLLFGETPYALIHELFFDSLEAARQGMASPQGRKAGRLLQELTGGNMNLFFADHMEDDLSHIHRYRQTDSADETLGDRP